MSVSDFVPALGGGQSDRDLLLAALTKRVIYPFDAGENPQTWTATVSGTVPLAIATEYGGVFFFDPLDEISAHDGVTVVVTADGKRYKSSNLVMPDAVDGIGIDEPVGDEEIGAAYITSSAPDGDFSYWPDSLVVLTSRGWVPIEPRLGRPVYVKGLGHYFQDENGDWLAVFLPQGGQIRDQSLVGGQRRYIVESQTLNTPPGSPAHGVYWIVGSSPTGAWAGFPGYIATKYDGDADWTLIAPKTGDEAYDKANAANYVWGGTSWDFAGGAWGRILHERTDGTGSTTSASGTAWTTAAAPTTSNARRTDNVTITIQALDEKKIKFTYSAELEFTLPGGNPYVAIALFRDSDGAAIRWKVYSAPELSPMTIDATFVWETDDNASHEYKIAIVPNVNLTISSIQRRDFMAEVSN